MLIMMFYEITTEEIESIHLLIKLKFKDIETRTTKFVDKNNNNNGLSYNNVQHD